MAFKTRPKVKAASWHQTYSDDMPFVLRDVHELVAEAHRIDGIDDYAALHAWLLRQLDARGVPRLIRPYVETAVENVLDVHDSIEADLGPLQVLALNPAVGPPARRLTVWGTLYTTVDGVREVRRVRVGSAHDVPTAADVAWSTTAAYVAATVSSLPAARRVRVVEIGAGDASCAVLFDGTPDEATTIFVTEGRDRARALVEQDHVVPCRSCGDCKVTGVCGGPVQVDGMLGQTAVGVVSRSVSPTALEKYARCPAQWLLDAEAHLPKEPVDSDAIVRGDAVHRWLETAHHRGTACNEADLPNPAGGAGLGLAGGVLTPDDYAAAYPYLRGHIAVCPLQTRGAAVVAVEETIYGWDASAQVVPATKPDLLYRLGDRLVIRETKSMQSPPGDKDDAYSRYLQVPFMLALLDAGLAALHAAVAGVVELEILGPDGPEVWAWATDDPVEVAVARADVRRAVDDWHVDTTFEAAPGPHCVWCPVRKWCPDRDAHQNPSGGQSLSRPDSWRDDEDEPPPF
ncbi:PD-(D/E)XK nuclease family protein (plasmid) [Rhodococcus antarcticus]|uniref:PD-(D/E)XK nuclease family protein n=1 Tax=Rhodococcus antarcticus TaxID=2987751 RepID=A0ABY6P5G6_9NOCA|nr:PD-(D/E)XK nuclease family protein [Rhodococcus antarcticus]UZJ26904.1 PD-(D/E)XK nuclease family protein [Rhodococcus antarcticus]